MTRNEAYKILNLDPSADEKAIKRAYRSAANKHHPDKGGDEEEFKKIKEAYEILSNKKKSTYTSQSNQSHYSNDDINDFFRHYRHQQQKNSRPVILNIYAKIEDVFNGLTKKLNTSMMKTCDECAGTGFTFNSSDTNGVGTCPKCNGLGHISITLTEEIHLSTEDFYSPRVFEDKKTGTKFIVKAHIISEENWDIEGLDLITNIKVPFYDLILGTQYTLELPNNKKINFNIPKGLKSTVKLSKLGVSISKYGNNETGDVYVNIQPMFPKEITSEQEELLKKFKELDEEHVHND